MAKAKKRVAARKKSSKRGNVSTKPARKLAAERATPKKAKSKARRADMSTKKPATEKKRPPDTAGRRQVAQMPVETTVTGVIGKPAPDVGVETERGEVVGPAGT
jgi:membrane protein involved in colicin uptake